jgi:signal transduction histidine kinase
MIEYSHRNMNERDMVMNEKDRRGQRSEYRAKVREIRKQFNENHYHTQKEMMDRLAALDQEYKNLRRSKHRHEDFEKYHRNLKLVRPLPVVFILVLWAVVFFNAGFSTSLDVMLLIFTIMVTAGSVFQIIFITRLERRILRPINDLKKGVNEIAGGNYEIQVVSDAHSYIDTLIDDFNAMARKLKETEELKNEYENNRKGLIANISHDLKTPITSIQGYIEAITESKDLPDEKMEKYLKIIHSNISYMNRLIDDLFLFSKLDMQKFPFEYSVVSVKPFMNDLMEEIKIDLEEKKIVFSFQDALDPDARIRIDTKRFHQVVRNIIDNAVKYGPADGLIIRADLTRQDGFIYLKLTDNGPGIPEAQLEHIFKRFYRLDNERTKDISSTGLGLAIAKELIEMQGGHISAFNAGGGGTCFAVALPEHKE